MGMSRLDVVASAFRNETEALHDRFLVMVCDPLCILCESSGFGHAILTAWLQNQWSVFTHDL